MGVQIQGHHILYRDDRFFAAFPSVQAAPDGTIFLGFRRAPDHRWMLGDRRDEDFDSVDHLHFRSHISLIRFDQGLQQQGDLQELPSHAEAADQDANLFLTSTGRLIQYGFLWYPIPSETMMQLKARELTEAIMVAPEGEAYLYWGGYTRFSEDMGVTWSDHQMMPTDAKASAGPFRYRPGGAALRGRMIEGPDGRLMVAGYERRLEGRDETALRIFQSDDMAESWQLHPDVVAMEGVWLQEPGMANWPEGQITIFNRTAAHEDRLVTMTSSDRGQSFDEPLTREVKGHPYDPLLLADGRLFLVYGYRHEPMGVRARLVAPGQAIEAAEEIIIRDDSPSRDVGYPSATQLPDGRILIAYYITDKAGIRGIECTVLTVD